MRRTALLALALLSGCGYHRLDTRPGTSPWHVRGETVRIDTFQNRTPRPGIEEPFRKALEHRIVAASPWRLVAQDASSRWLLRVTLEDFQVRPLGLSLGSPSSRASAGTASRVEIVVVASVQLLDGLTGAVALARPRLTFSNQYRADQNFASFENRELKVLEGLADDFAESFITQMLQGSD